MDFRTSSLAVGLSLVAACSATTAATALDDIRGACNTGAQHVEAHLSGYVARVLGIRAGASGSHEGFILATADCSHKIQTCPVASLKVEDNVDITGVIPLRRGERVELQGQYECNDGVIHWTHRDPRGRHIAGYIRVNGNTYQ
jgi:hypothetical protein